MRKSLAALCLSLLAAACSVGPKSIPRDQFDYGMAIAAAGREQILKNIVGLRYVEAPVFVDVASVINQYALEGEVAVGAGKNTSFTGDNTLTFGGASRWADRPTITYTPVAGKKFAASLLTPLPPESLFALVQGGWPAETILRLTVKSINGIENAWAGPARRRQADPDFNELLRVWGRLRDARVLGLRRSVKEEGAQILVYVNQQKISDEVARDLEFFYRTLDIDPEARDARLSYGLIPDKPNEIVVLTTSILELMNELAWRIDVPQDHLEERRTISSFVLEDPDLDPLITVHHATELPADAFVSIQSRGVWFYIDDRDVLSKRTFALLQILLSLTDTSTEARGPVVSITN
jgi:hypothetical protein